MDIQGIFLFKAIKVLIDVSQKNELTGNLNAWKVVMVIAKPILVTFRCDDDNSMALLVNPTIYTNFNRYYLKKFVPPHSVHHKS